MDCSLFGSIVSALSAILGVGFGASMQLRAARESQHAQYNLEVTKLNAMVQEKKREMKISGFTEIHKILTKIDREYSLTSLDIMSRGNLAEEEYDRIYLLSCESLDNALAIADLSFPSLAGVIEKIHGPMNVFWGNFKEICALQKVGGGAKINEFHSRAVAASLEVGRCVRGAKEILNSQVRVE